MSGGFLSWELQKAVVAALIADSGIQALVGNPARVFDWVEPTAILPYIAVGNSASENTGSKGSPPIESQNHEISFDVFSAEGGRGQIKRIQAAIFDVLDFATLSLDDVSQLLICIQYTSSDDNKEDTQRFSGTIVFSAITQKV